MKKSDIQIIQINIKNWFILFKISLVYIKTILYFITLAVENRHKTKQNKKWIVLNKCHYLEMMNLHPKNNYIIK